MCHEYWDEWKEIQEIEEQAKKKAEEIIQKAKAGKPNTATEPMEAVENKETEAA